MIKYIIKGRINMGSGRFGLGAWKPIRLTSFATKKEAQDVADRLNLRGTGCVEYKVFKEGST